MEEKIGFERWKKCKRDLKKRWYRIEAIMVLIFCFPLFAPISSIQAQGLHQDEKSVESKEQQAQQTKSGRLKKYEEVIHSGVRSIPRTE